MLHTHKNMDFASKCYTDNAHIFLNIPNDLSDALQVKCQQMYKDLKSANFCLSRPIPR